MAETKLPAFQFYPADWRKDPGIQSLTFEDRGVWFEILCLMHESPRRGVLLLPNGTPMMSTSLARIIGMPTPRLVKALDRISAAGVSDREEVTGALMNRRMVRDENLRQVRVQGGEQGAEYGRLGGEFGKLGGRPKKTPVADSGKPPSQPPIKPAPSSSPSSSSSEEKNTEEKKGTEPSAEKRTRPPDPAFEHFSSEFRAHLGTAYVHKNGDFVQLATLRKANALPARAVPDGWESAVSNYFGSPLSMWTLADLCVRFATYRNSTTDRYQVPVNHVGNGNGNGNGKTNAAAANLGAAQDFVSRKLAETVRGRVPDVREDFEGFPDPVR